MQLELWEPKNEVPHEAHADPEHHKRNNKFDMLTGWILTAIIDGQMGWAKWVARGMTRFGPAQARTGPHKDGPGRHSPLWRAMLGPLPRHVGRHGHDPF
jgi:hypothetical protein